MAPRFDPSRPHGRITGDFHGATVEQDGNFFGPEGRFLFDQDSIPGAGAKAAAPAAAPAPKPKEGNDGIDVIAWAMGEAKYPWFAIQKALREHGINASSAADAIKAMIAEGMIAEVDVKR